MSTNSERDYKGGLLEDITLLLSLLKELGSNCLESLRVNLIVQIQDRLDFVMVVLLEDSRETIDDTTKLLTAEVLLSRALGIFAELLETSFHGVMLDHVGLHQTRNTRGLLDFREVGQLLAELVVVDEIIGDTAVLEEIGCLLCSRDDMRCLLVDCVESAEEGVVSHSHDLSILDAVVIVGDLRNGRCASIGDQAEGGLGPTKVNNWQIHGNSEVMLTRMDTRHQYEQVHGSPATKTTQPNP